MSTQYTVPNIPASTTVNDLQQAVSKAMQNLVGQLNGQSTQLDAMGQRVINVATPTSPNDAVPLRYLKYFHQKGTQVSNKNAGTGLDAYTIVFSNAGTATNGNQSPPFAVGSDRAGNPEEAWLAAIETPTGSFTVNFLHGTSIADCTHTMLATNLLLISGSGGPVYQTTFNTGMSLSHGNIIIMQVINGAAAATFSGGIVVRRG